jgi:hypothetical protein
MPVTSHPNQAPAGTPMASDAATISSTSLM